MQPGVMLTKEDAPAIPDPERQSICRSFVAKLQFAATWVRYDIAYAVSHESQLATFLCFGRSFALNGASSPHLLSFGAPHVPTSKVRYPKNSTNPQGLDGYCVEFYSTTL
jgi:hypothetical protein